MNNIIIIALLMCTTMIFAEDASAQSTSWMIEGQVGISPEQDQQVYAQPWIWGSKSFKDSKWGVGCFALVGEGWGELLVGPSYTFQGKRGFTEVGAQIGIETYPSSPYRGMAYIFHKTRGEADGRHDLTYLLVGEYGGSGRWHVGFINYNVTKRIGLGLIAQHSNAYGPRIQINIPSGFVWFGGGLDLENSTNEVRFEDKAIGAILGVRIFM